MRWIRVPILDMEEMQGHDIQLKVMGYQMCGCDFRKKSLTTTCKLRKRPFCAGD